MEKMERVRLPTQMIQRTQREVVVKEVVVKEVEVIEGKGKLVTEAAKAEVDVETEVGADGEAKVVVEVVAEVEAEVEADGEAKEAVEVEGKNERIEPRREQVYSSLIHPE